MSPDPPREDSGDDENRIRRFSGEFVEGMINDEEFFIVPDAPYELDMDVESEYTDSEEEGATGEGARNNHNSRTLPNVVTLVGDEQEFLFQEGQGRGRYRLLIPFPNSTTAAANESVTDIASDSSNNDTKNVSSEVNQNTSGATEHCSSGGQDLADGNTNASTEFNETSSSDPSNHLIEENQPKSSSSGDKSESKREIEMTDEKVEKIKEVMKNITLPSTSIPKWASEIDEDSWRKKLNESIGSSGRLTTKTDKNFQRTEARGQT